MALRLVPVTLAEAKRFIGEHHRHNDPPTGHRVSVGVANGEGLCGVGVLSRPMARGSDDGTTAEITRVATDGTRNACSMLYGALTRAAWALGYDRLVTYTLDGENGASLRASGWTEDGTIDREPWQHTSGPRAIDKPTLFYDVKMPSGVKRRWIKHRGAQT